MPPARLGDRHPGLGLLGGPDLIFEVLKRFFFMSVLVC